MQRAASAHGADAGVAAANDIGFARPGLPTADGYVTQRTVVVTFGVARTAKLLLHELTHAEMATYTPYDTLPTWFNEGAAAMVATDTTRELYCQSRRELERWSEKTKGRRAVGDALVRLMRGVAEGTPFDLLYASGAAL